MAIKELRTKARSKGRAIVISMDATHVYLRPLGKHKRNAYAVSIADVFRLAAQQARAAHARDKARAKRIRAKLRKAAKGCAPDEPAPNVLTSDEELFMLGHLAHGGVRLDHLRGGKS